MHLVTKTMCGWPLSSTGMRKKTTGHSGPNKLLTLIAFLAFFLLLVPGEAANQGVLIHDKVNQDASVAQVGGFLPCDICGSGLTVGNPDGQLRDPSSGQTISCGEAQLAGLNRLVDPFLCRLLPSLAAQACDCHPVEDGSEGDTDEETGNFPPCDICGSGLTVGNPDGQLQDPSSGQTISCGEAQLAGLNGLVDPSLCRLIPSVAAQACDCRPVEDGSEGGTEEETSPPTPPPKVEIDFPGRDHLFEGRPLKQRSPCPGLNTLANHGFIGRDGTVIVSALREAAQETFGIGGSAIDFFVESAKDAGLPTDLITVGNETEEIFSLFDLYSTSLDHDASLVRRDSSVEEFAQFDPSLFIEMVQAAGTSDRINNAQLASFASRRVLHSRRNSLQPNLNLEVMAGEYVILFAFGYDEQLGSVPLSYLDSFLRSNRFPDNWVPRPALGLPVLDLSGPAVQALYAYFYDNVSRAATLPLEQEPTVAPTSISQQGEPTPSPIAQSPTTGNGKELWFFWIIAAVINATIVLYALHVFYHSKCTRTKSPSSSNISTEPEDEEERCPIMLPQVEGERFARTDSITPGRDLKWKESTVSTEPEDEEEQCPIMLPQVEGEGFAQTDSIMPGRDLTWKELTMEVPHGKGKELHFVLRNVSGTAPSGHITCILGHSGAGKTSLLKILAGRIKDCAMTQIRGQILVEGRQVDPSKLAELHDLRLAYVAQQDSLLSSATVKEALHFSARLRLHRTVTDEEISHLIETVIEDLRLKYRSDHFIGKLSGGEKRRVSLGVELVTRPKILLIDEVTSGLDSHNAKVVMDVCQRVAVTRNMSILMTIHQPNREIVEMMDRVVIMHEGMCMYEGPLLALPAYYSDRGFEYPGGNTILTDWALQVSQTTPLDQLKEKGFFSDAESTAVDDAKYRSSRLPLVAPANSPSQRATIRTEIQELFRRELKHLQNDPVTLAARVAIVSLLSALIAACFSSVGRDSLESNARFISHAGAVFLLTFCCAISTLLVLQDACAERPVFCREFITGHYCLFSHAFVKLIMTAVVTAVYATCYVLITFWSLALTGNSAVWLVRSFLLGLVFDALGLLLAAIPEDPYTALNLLVLPFTAQQLLSGFLVLPSALPAYISWAVWLVPLTYGFRLALYDEFQDCLTSPLAKEYVISCFKALESAQHQFDEGAGLDALYGEDSLLMLIQAGQYAGTRDIIEYLSFISPEQNPFSMLWDDCRETETQQMVVNEAGDGFCDITLAGISHARLNKEFEKSDDDTSHWYRYMIGRRILVTYPPDLSTLTIVTENLYLSDPFIDFVYNQRVNDTALAQEVCTTMNSFCPEIFGLNGFQNTEECSLLMQTLPVATTNKADLSVVDGNSTGCRNLHASLAAVNPETHCPHLSITPIPDNHGKVKCSKSADLSFEGVFADSDLALFEFVASRNGIDRREFYENVRFEDLGSCGSGLVEARAVEAAEVLPRDFYCRTYLEDQGATGDNNTIYWWALVLFWFFFRVVGLVLLRRRATL